MYKKRRENTMSAAERMEKARRAARRRRAQYGIRQDRLRLDDTPGNGTAYALILGCIALG